MTEKRRRALERMADARGKATPFEREAARRVLGKPSLPSLYYVCDADGEPVPCAMMEWAMCLERDGMRQVADDLVGGEVRVSTIFLGMDHGWGRGDPVLWESMVFGGPMDGWQERYTSRADALAGHAALVAAAKEF